MAAAVLLNSPGNGRESSPRTPETNFRELDEAFLQSQARIWLGAILDKRFDEGINISDLLADGQILYELYQVIQKCLEDRNGTSVKVVEQERISPRDITEKYPYPKVECFLRICQTLGLEDIDLFTSSDVVHKRNTRGVCLCLRFLSKKARLKKLNVPDFDFVTYKTYSPVTMPTDMVGNRRRNLERSSSSACSSSQDTSKDSRGKHYWQGDSNLGSSPETSINCKSDASHDDGGDEEEDINSEVVESAIRTPTRFLCDDDASSLVHSGSSIAEKSEHHVEVEVEDSFSPGVVESIGSPYSNLEDKDHRQQLDCTPVVASVGDNFVQIMDNNQTNNDNGSGSRAHADHTPVHLSWQNGSVEVEDLEESNIIAKRKSSGEITQSCLMEGKGINPKDGDENDDGLINVNSNAHNNAKEAWKSVTVVESNGKETEKMNPPADITHGSGAAGQGYRDDDILQYVKNTDDQEDGEPNPLISDESKPAPHSSSSRRTNKMKSLIVKGTGTAAIIGLALLFLQFRKNVKGKKEGQNSCCITETNNTNRNNNENAENRFSRVRERLLQANRVYPSDRLQLR